MKKRVWLFLLLTAANAVIFFFRDHFQYEKHSTYAELYAPCDPACLSDKYNFGNVFDRKERLAAVPLLASLPLTKGTTLAKAETLGRFLYSRLHPNAAANRDTSSRAAILQLYLRLSKSPFPQVDCGTFALLYNFFCWTQNIHCRNIEIFRPGDHHVVNEVYLPDEKRWVLVDLTSNLLKATQNDRLLNTVDLIQALDKTPLPEIFPADGTGPVSFARFPERKSLRHYYQARFRLLYYRAERIEKVYSTAEKIKRYFWPRPWYDWYTPAETGNPLFYVRLFFVAVWLILTGMIVYKLRRT